MPRSRIAVGFHRIGVVLAAPIICLGLWLGYAGWRDSRPLPLCTGMFDDLIPNGGSRPTCLQPAPGAKDRGPWDLYWDRYSQREVYGAPVNYEPALLAFTAAIFLYAASCALGWIVRGFCRGANAKP